MHFSTITLLAVSVLVLCVVLTQYGLPRLLKLQIRQRKRYRLRRLLREHGGDVMRDLGRHQLYYVEDIEADRKRAAGKRLWHAQQARHPLWKLLTLFRQIQGPPLLGHWVESRSTKLFYLRTTRQLHYSVLWACLVRWYAQRWFFLSLVSLELLPAPVGELVLDRVALLLVCAMQARPISEHEAAQLLVDVAPVTLILDEPL